jgi:hypothetical protein
MEIYSWENQLMGDVPAMFDYRRVPHMLLQNSLEDDKLRLATKNWV